MEYFEKLPRQRLIEERRFQSRFQSVPAASLRKSLFRSRKETEAKKQAGEKSEIVSRDASVVGSNLGRGTRANPNPAYPESNFESFESDPPALLWLPSPGRNPEGGGGRKRERTEVVGPRNCSRILSPLEGPCHPWNTTFPSSLSCQLLVSLSPTSSCFFSISARRN